jgi:hypothetical protein
VAIAADEAVTVASSVVVVDVAAANLGEASVAATVAATVAIVVVRVVGPLHLTARLDMR